MLMCWQLTISLSQILAAAITKGIEPNQTTLAYRLPIGFQLLFPAVVFTFFAFVPESPRWLLRVGKDERVRAALQAIHKDDIRYNPEQDIVHLQAAIDAEEGRAAESSWLSLLTNPIERRKLIFSAGALFAQQINGIQWFYYFGTVFSKAIGLKDPFLMAVIVFLIQALTVFLAVLLANKIPRRPLLLTTTAIMTVSIFIVGCLGIPGGDDVSPMFGKVILSFVILEIAAFNFGWGPLGWTIVSPFFLHVEDNHPARQTSLHTNKSQASEMAVGRNRNKIYAIAVASFWITVWVVVFTLPYLYYSADLGPKTGFIYTGLCFVSLAYVYFCVGEVTGRSMEEIEGFFANVRFFASALQIFD